MVSVASAIADGPRVRHPTAPPPFPERPGWVYELVVAVLTDAGQPLRPQEVIHGAERLHGQRIAPSSIRNCLRGAANRPDNTIERVGYGRYRLKRG